MTEANQTEVVESKELAKEAAPQVDTKAIQDATNSAVQEATQKAIEKATQEVDKAIKGALKKVAGEKDEGQDNPLLNALVNDTKSTLQGLVGLSVQEAKKQIKIETDKSTEDARVIQSVSSEFLDKYPDLGEHMDIVQAFTVDESTRQGPDYDLRSALKKGYETTVKKLKLKTAEEKGVSEKADQAAFPAGFFGGSSSGDKPGSQPSDYIKNLKDYSKKFREPQVQK
jgi:hypothetical protein